MIWSVKKQKWFSGPLLPKVISNEFDQKCGIAVDSSTAYIFSKDGAEVPPGFKFNMKDYTFSYNFIQKKWKSHAKPPPSYFPYRAYFIQSCTLLQSKDYKREVYILALKQESFILNAVIDIYVYDVELDVWRVLHSGCNLGWHITNVFGTLFNANILHEKSKKSLTLQYNELDTSLENNIVVCKKNVSRPIEFEKHSIDENFSIYLDLRTSFFVFFGRCIF